MNQPSLFDPVEEDEFIWGSQQPALRWPDHSHAQMRRPFIMWDGEGYTDEFGHHHYWLLANSLGDKIVAPPGRSLHRYSISRLFAVVNATYPNAINVGFAMGYDFTCMLRGNGLTDKEAQTLKTKQYLVGEDNYVWQLRAGKMLTVYLAAASEPRFTLFDTWGFFQRSFVKALDEYFGDAWPHRDTIVAMKNLRSSFDRQHDADVMSYNDMELELGVMLMEELRTRLYAANLLPSQWYGPGAIAKKLLGKWKAKQYLSDLYTSDPGPAAAAQHAYAGGRFELLKPGHMGGPVYQYDINSAYPWAIAQLPDWRNGKWVYRKGGSVASLGPYTVARVRWHGGTSYNIPENGPTSELEIFPESIPFPLWNRDRQGNICYPSARVHGWYWSVEIRAASRYLNSLPDWYDHSIEVVESWEWIPDNPDTRPYAEIWELYEFRQELKARGNGAHIGIKLGLNSLYGSLAQQVGWREDNDRMPPYHHIAAAGWVTANCRALIIDGMALDPQGIIAVETDGIFSLRELDLPCSTRLGEWDRTVYDDMWYFQSGFRFGIINHEVVKPATRGIPVKDINLDDVIDTITNSTSTISVPTQQFISIGLALHRGKPHTMGQWITIDGGKELTLMCEDPRQKRIHDPTCPQCVYKPGTDIRVYAHDAPHMTFPRPKNDESLSAPHKVLWSSLTADSQRDVWEHEKDGLETL